MDFFECANCTDLHFICVKIYLRYYLRKFSVYDPGARSGAKEPPTPHSLPPPLRPRSDKVNRENCIAFYLRS